MRKAHLPWPRIAPAANQRMKRRGVMWRAERSLPELARIEAPAAHRCDGRDVQRLSLAERREQARQTLRQHAFARSGWPGHQQTMRARRRDGERTLGVLLALHVAQIQ